MTELRQFVKSRENRTQPSEDLGSWMPLAEARRPHTPSLRCPHPGCGGQLQIAFALPGLYELSCLQGAHIIGEILESDLKRWVGSTGMVYVAAHYICLLWERDQTVAP